MPSNRTVHVRTADDGVAARTLRKGIAQIQAELDVDPEFPAGVEEVAAASAAAPRLPELDRTDLDLVTIDPPGARDLDQALFLERVGDGYRVYYAIADVAAFVTPRDAVDEEAHRRGQTLYGADSKIRLHPAVISEDAGSLLPEQVRPALLWTIDVDATGEGTDVVVERALVRSRAQLDYGRVQRMLDDGDADESLRLLKEVGMLRQAREASRGGVSLPIPEQEVDVRGRHLGPGVPPPARRRALERPDLAADRLRRRLAHGVRRDRGPAHVASTRPPGRATAAPHGACLHIEWPAEQLYPDFIRTLDPAQPAQAAMVVACTRLLRGSGYAAFDGEVPEQPMHAALASEYAHVTAPLRRLVDRYAGEICVALCSGSEVPQWVLDRLDDLPAIMRDSGRRRRRTKGRWSTSSRPRCSRRTWASGSTGSWSRWPRRTHGGAR